MRFVCGFSLAWFLFACAPQSEKIDPFLVAATIRPYALIAGELAGDRLRVETILPPSASPHTYSPRPRDLERANKAGLIIMNGLGLEARLGSFLDRLAGRALSVASVLGLDADAPGNEQGTPPVGSLRKGAGAHDDPHFWTDPALMIRFAGILAARFSALDPDGEEEYTKRYIQFTNNISTLDRRIADEAALYSVRSVITFHDAFIRFFTRYGIERIAAVTPVPGRDPSAARLAELGDLIRAHKVRALYSEPELDPKGARILADAYGLPVYMLDPLGTGKSITDYSSLISYNWEQLQKGFVR
jgi:zinc transport system substrate-binding protein